MFYQKFCLSSSLRTFGNIGPPPPQLVLSRNHGLQFQELIIAFPEDVVGQECNRTTKNLCKEVLTSLQNLVLREGWRGAGNCEANQM
jgi:hypothetical protein